MIVSEFKTSEDEQGRRLSAIIQFEANPPRESEIWVRLPTSTAMPATPGDALLVLLALPSMALGERLAIGTPVSRELAAAECDRVLPVMTRWFPRLQSLDLECVLLPGAESKANSVASMFSGGIDSWRTLLEYQNELTHLIHIRGFEINLENEHGWEVAHAAARTVANDFDKQMLTVETNLRQVVISRIREIHDRTWENFFIHYWSGHLLVGIGLLLRPLVGKLIIPGSYSPGTERVGSAHGIEPALSTNAMEIVLDSIGETRLDKACWLQDNYPEFLARLRVCFDNSGRPLGDKLNCGQCSKCVRTAIELRVSGIPNYAEPFYDLMPLHEARLKKGFCTDVDLWEDIVPLAKQRNDVAALEAAEMIMGQHRRKRRMFRLLRKIRKKLFFWLGRNP